MDRRRFLVQGLAASSAYVLPLSGFARRAVADFICVRPGKISQGEFLSAIKEAKAANKGLLLHPQTKVTLTSDIILDVHVTGSDATIAMKDDAVLTIVNRSQDSQVITGVNFEGSVYFIDSEKQIVAKNVFKAVRSSAVTAENTKDLHFIDNEIQAGHGHALVIRNDSSTVVSGNKITQKGEGQFLWLEETQFAEVSGNTFRNVGKGSPTVVVRNQGDVNPNIKLENNTLA